MGDSDNRSGIGGEEPLEPRDRLGVEMVRRLVEKREIRRGQQHPCERDAAAFAAGKRGHTPVAVGRRRASIARSIVASSDHASTRSICSCTFACSAISSSKSASGSENAAEISSKRVRRCRSRRMPCSTFPRTSFVGSSSGSCPSSPTVAPAASSARPDDGSSRPAMIRSKVDLPAPFAPSTPISAGTRA